MIASIADDWYIERGVSNQWKMKSVLLVIHVIIGFQYMRPLELLRNSTWQ